MYYKDIPDGIKYKVIKGNKAILNSIKERHQKQVDKYWTKLDSFIISKDDSYYLILEQTEPEIVEDMKERLKTKIRKIKDELLLNSKETISLIQETKHCKYVYDFYWIANNILWFEFPNLKLLYNDLRNPLDKVFNIVKYTPKKRVYSNNIDIPSIESILNIDISVVLDKLWIDYEIRWNEIILYDNWNRTDWWRWNIEKNFITDFSWKDRPQWNSFSFIVSYLQLSNYQTYLWFKENFNL